MSFPLLSQSVDSYLSSLKSGSDSEKEQACTYLGEKGSNMAKTVVSEVIIALKTTTNSDVALACANALGYFKLNGPSTEALKERITTDKNTDVVYASLLALLNITVNNKQYEPAAKEAMEFADKNHRDDEFVADLLDKIKAQLQQLGIK